MGDKFLGRTFDPLTMTYAFHDGSGRVPEEMRQDVLDALEKRMPAGGNLLTVLGTILLWKDRIALKNITP